MFSKFPTNLSSECFSFFSQAFYCFYSWITLHEKKNADEQYRDWTISKQQKKNDKKHFSVPTAAIVFRSQTLCLFYHWSYLLWEKKKGKIWSKILPSKKVERNETFRYLHKIMLLGDTLEFKVKTEKRKQRIVAEKKHRFTTFFYCLFHWKIDGNFFLPWTKTLREKMGKIKRLF